MSGQNPNAAIEGLNAQIQDFLAAQATLETELKTATENSGASAKEALKVANETAEKIGGISNQILEIQQQAHSDVISGKEKPQTLGQMVIAADGFDSYASGNGGKSFTFQANTIIGQDGSPLENSDTLVAPDRLPGIIPGAFRSLKVQDVLPQAQTGSNMVEYTRELLFTNNAAETNEGEQKPESVLTFELVQAPIKTIAHFIKVSNQVLDDAPALQSYIDTRLRFGVEKRIDEQLLKGNGTGGNISGILNTGNHTVFTPTTGENALDSINRAIYKVYEADYAPTAIIMNPADWGAIERIKRGSSDAAYVIGDPSAMIGPRLWGLPVVVTNAMTAGSFVVAAFDIAYQVWNREGTKVEMFAQDEDNVQKNLITVRAEGRKALAVYRPASAYSGLLVEAA